MLTRAKFFAALTHAVSRAEDLRRRGLPFGDMVWYLGLMPGVEKPPMNFTDSMFSDNPVFIAVDVGSRTNGVRPAYSEIAVAEEAWEFYENNYKQT